MNAALPEFDQPDFLSTFRGRVAEDLHILASIHDKEPGTELIKNLKEIEFPECLTIQSQSKLGTEAARLLSASIKTLTEKINDKILDELAVDYAGIYLNHSFSASPEESVWVDEDGLVCQQSMFQVRNWYHQYHLTIPDWRQRPDDHLVYELQFIAFLMEQDDSEQTLNHIAKFMDEHLLRWLGDFSERVMTRCDTQFFAGAAAVTASYCEDLRNILAELTGNPRPTFEEIEERMKPKAVETEEVPLQYMPGMGPTV
jgi:TorA maturation chaperone TorD